jgi:hypothetical protein
MARDRRKRVTKPDMPMAIAAERQRSAFESGIFGVGQEPYRCPRCSAPHDAPPSGAASLLCPCGLTTHFNIGERVPEG